MSAASAVLGSASLPGALPRPRPRHARSTARRARLIIGIEGAEPAPCRPWEACRNALPIPLRGCSGRAPPIPSERRRFREPAARRTPASLQRAPFDRQPRRQTRVVAIGRSRTSWKALHRRASRRNTRRLANAPSAAAIPASSRNSVTFFRDTAATRRSNAFLSGVVRTSMLADLCPRNSHEPLSVRVRWTSCRKLSFGQGFFDVSSSLRDSFVGAIELRQIPATIKTIIKTRARYICTMSTISLRRNFA